MSSNVKPVLAVFDSKSKIYSDPQTFASLADAVRSLISLAEQSPQHPWIRFADDFQPFHIADWNPEDATLKMLSHPVGLGTLRSIIPAPVAPQNLERFPTPMNAGSSA